MLVSPACSVAQSRQHKIRDCSTAEDQSSRIGIGKTGGTRTQSGLLSLLISSVLCRYGREVHTRTLPDSHGADEWFVNSRLHS